MDQQTKEAAELAAGMFLETMPEDVAQRYFKQKLHHQLAYFFCWCQEMESLTEEE